MTYGARRIIKVIMYDAGFIYTKRDNDYGRCLFSYTFKMYYEYAETIMHTLYWYYCKNTVTLILLRTTS